MRGVNVKAIVVPATKRIKRMFNIAIETCSQCGGNVKVIA